MPFHPARVSLGLLLAFTLACTPAAAAGTVQVSVDGRLVTAQQTALPAERGATRGPQLGGLPVAGSFR